MITIRQAAACAAGAVSVIMLLASCSSSDDSTAAADQPSTTSSSPPAASTSSSTTTFAADDATTEACRSLAEDEDLAEFWKQVNNQPAVRGWVAMRASMAVMRLGKYTPDPAVESSVSTAMATAVTEMGNMNQEIADGGQFDIERFRGIVTPVVQACQNAGVDMSIPE